MKNGRNQRYLHTTQARIGRCRASIAIGFEYVQLFLIFIVQIKTRPMKKKSLTIFLCVILAFLLSDVFGQVGIGTSDPDSCAALEVESTSGGILFPRLTTSQIFYIDGPKPGLVVFNIDSLDLWFYEGSRWRGVNDAADTLNPLSWYCGIDTLYQGKYYKTVLIGSQCWMAENLAATKYNDGTSIPLVTDGGAWGTLTSPGYCYYNNDSATYSASYGTLYNFYTVADTNSRNVCPVGWHAPSDAEWTTLTDYIGGTGSPHGNELKSCRQVNSPLGGNCNTSAHPRWNEHGTHYGTDDYGFSGLPGGLRTYNGDYFDWIGYRAYWWSSKGSGSGAYIRSVLYNTGYVTDAGYLKQHGLSVRCIKDE